MSPRTWFSVRGAVAWVVALLIGAFVVRNFEYIMEKRDWHTLADSLINAVEQADFSLLFAFVTQVLISDFMIGVASAALVFALWDTAPRVLADKRTRQTLSARTLILNRSATSGTRLEGWIRSDRDDYDLIPADLVVRGLRSDDGIDISATIKYRNRSKDPINLKSVGADFEVDGRVPVGKLSHGISAVIPAEKTDGIPFCPVRVYSDERKTRGHATFTVMFGASPDAVSSALEMSYDFTVLSYPSKKGAAEILKVEKRERTQYYAKESS